MHDIFQNRSIVAKDYEDGRDVVRKTRAGDRRYLDETDRIKMDIRIVCIRL